ncbi:hypothetical protein CMEL01_02593 [Colletotrichum melonis]|uniref:Uncharacterized protein n=2 Tax=Colletotrichum acutatum species complex TaxID=2707335 RepID=A0AAI9XTH4_9PEZI|nr:hypothetical protein CMEL01_02593 [Colletotrichum melonis]
MTKEKHHQRHIVIVCAQIEDHIFLFPPLSSSSLSFVVSVSLSSVPASCHPPLGSPLPAPSDLCNPSIFTSQNYPWVVVCSPGRWVQMQNMTDVAGYRKGGESPLSRNAAALGVPWEMCRVIKCGFHVCALNPALPASFLNSILGIIA